MKTFEYYIKTNLSEHIGTYQAKNQAEAEKALREIYSSDRQEFQGEKEGKPHTFVNEAMEVQEIKLTPVK